MKKRISISAVAMATLAILFLTAVPHHHHGVQICFATEHCDAHEHQVPCEADPSEHGHDESSCFLTHGTFLIEAENAGIRIGAAQNELLRLFCEAVDFAQTFTVVLDVHQYDYGDEIASEYFAECPSQCGLRAPPMC